MSARFWLFSLTSAGAALASGLGLGLYATTPPRMALSGYESTGPVLQSEDTSVDMASLSGPTAIDCKGCGPTLAQRQMAAMTGGWDGYDDPVVRDYAAQDHAAPEDLLAQADPPPQPVQLPADVERFAAGESGSAQTMQLAQHETNVGMDQQGVP